MEIVEHADLDEDEVHAVITDQCHRAHPWQACCAPVGHAKAQALGYSEQPLSHEKFNPLTSFPKNPRAFPLHHLTVYACMLLQQAGVRVKGDACRRGEGLSRGRRRGWGSGARGDWLRGLRSGPSFLSGMLPLAQLAAASRLRSFLLLVAAQLATSCCCNS